MVGKTHMVVGTSISIVALGSSALTPAVIIPVILGALTPDIDIDGSTISQRCNELAKTLIIYGAVIILFIGVLKKCNMSLAFLNFYTPYMKQAYSVSLLIFIAAVIMSRLTGHRGFSHSFLGLIIFTAVIALINVAAVKWFVIGFLSHLALDLLNYKGEKLLFPIQTNVKLGLCKAGGVTDTVIFVGCVALIITKLLTM